MNTYQGKRQKEGSLRDGSRGRREKHQDQDWPQESAHIAEKEKQGDHPWVVCIPHTLLHFILPNTLDNGPIILILLTRSQDWASLSSQIFSLYARHSVKYFLWIIFSNSHNYLSLAPWSPFYKKPLGRDKNHLPGHTHLIRGASGTWTQAGPSHTNSGLFTQSCFTNWSRKEVVLHEPKSLAFSVIPHCQGRSSCLQHRKRRVSQEWT